MHIRNGALALAVTAALSSQAFVAPTARAGSTGKLRRDVQPSHGQPRFKYPNQAHLSVGTVLYDQTGVAENGAPAQDFQSAYDPYDSVGADDFVVTDAEGWTIGGFNFQVAFFDAGNPASPPASIVYDVAVYDDANGLPGTASCTYSGVVGALDASSTSLSIALPWPCALAQGTYWVSLQPAFDFPPQSFWSNESGAPIGNEGVWREGGGFGTSCTAWSAISTCVDPNSIPIGGANPNYLFQVVGSVGANAGCNDGEICLVSTVGTDLTPGACSSSDTIDTIVGDQVNFCYTVTNNTGIELDYHTLANNVDGMLFREMNQTVAPGGTFQFNAIETVGQTNTYNSTWTAQDVPSGYAAEVESGGANCADRIFADGFEMSAPVCAAGQFIDITGTGTPLGLGDDDATAVTMPFSFDFYGTTSNQLCVDNNGFVAFDTSSCAAFANFFFENGELPDGFFFSPVMMPLWDDFASTTGDVYTDIRGATPNRQFIVEWFDRVHYPATSNTDGATFELILNEGGAIQFEYSDAQYTGAPFEAADCGGGACATIGLQNDMGLFNQFSAFENAVADNSGIAWTASSPQIFTSTSSATVNVGAPQIVVDPNPLAGTGAPGASGTIPFSVENVGDRDLNWTLGEAASSNLHFPPPGSRFAMPLGDPAKTSAGPAPVAQRHPQAHKPTHSSFHVPFAGAATVFAQDLYQGSFETFDALNPSVVNTVAPGQGQAMVGGAFVDGDFSKFYAIAGDFGGDPGSLFAIDTPTGATKFIADANNNLGEGYGGLAYDSSTGTMFAASTTCGSSSHLWTIDRATGATTLVGEITGASCIVAIAVDAQGEMYGLDIATDALFAIDKSNATAALIGSIGFNANYGQDMAFDLSTGILYLAGFDGTAFTDSIYTVDLQTGVANIVGPIGAGLAEVDAMSIETIGGPCAQPQDLPWLSLNPVAGMTAPGTLTPITASIDGTGTVDGDVLAGTVCATSNDPQHHLLQVPLQYTVATPPPPPTPTVDKSFAPSTVAPGETSTLTITLSNAAAVTSNLTAALTDPFPAGLVVAPMPNASSDCGGAVTAVAGAGTVTLDATGSAIPAGGACTIHVDVLPAGIGAFVNQIDGGSLQTSTGNNAAAATATLTASLNAPTLAKAFNPLSVVAGASSTLTITLGNSNAAPVVLASPLTDVFPLGLVVAATPNASTTCGGALQAVAGDDHVTLDAVASIIPTTGCTITVDTAAALPGDYANSIPAGALQTDAGANAQSADATLNVAPLPPTIDKAFAPQAVVVNTPSTLTITLSNANATVDSLTAALIDAFPPGLVVAAAPNASTTCGGALTAVSGAGSVTLDAPNAAIPANGSCTIIVDVEAASVASFPNSIPAGALQTDAGNNSGPANATLQVTP